MHRRIAVVIPVRNDGAALAAAVESVLDQTLVPDEIAVVVGPSADDTADVASALASNHEAVVVLDNPDGGTPQALNLGIRGTTGDIVVRVDARSVLPRPYVEHAVESLEATGGGNIGAIQVPQGTTPVQRAIASAMSSRLGSGGAGYRHSTALVRADTGYLGVFRRSALESVGGFDETFVRNQDAELNARLNAAGHQVWVDPRLRVVYRPRSSVSGLASQYWQYGWWRLKTVRKSGTIAARQLAVPSAVVAVVGSSAMAIAGFEWALVVPGVYLLGLGVAAAGADGLGLGERAVLVGALAVMHFSWAAGFLASAVASLRPAS